MEIEHAPKGGTRWRQIREEFVDAQAGKCAICDCSLGAAPQLDHCHESGFIRGALCTSCNTKLGWYEGRREAIETYLARAAEFQAYGVAARIPRKRAARSEYWRKYWQDRERKAG